MSRNLAVGAGSVAVLGLALWVATSVFGGGGAEPDWGLHIVIFDVGQADAIVVVGLDDDGVPGI